MKYNKIKQTGLSIACVLALVGCGSNSNTVAETQITTATVETETEPATEVAESVEQIESAEPVTEPTEPTEQTVQTVADYEVEQMTSQTMYAQQSVNLRQGPATTYDKVGSLSTNQSVTVTGKVTTDNSIWYQLSTGEFVSEKYIGTDKVAVQAPSNNNSNNNSNSNTGSSQSSSSSEGQTVTGSGTGDRSGTSRENRAGSTLDWSGTAGGNLQ